MSSNSPSPPSDDRAPDPAAADARLRLALEAARMGTWERNLITGEDYWSPQEEALFGLDQGGFSSRHQAFLEMVHPEDRPKLDEAARRAIDDNVPYASEFRVTLRDGSVRWMVGRGDVIRDADGRPIRMLGITADITDRKLAEDERTRLLAAEKQAREEAEAANRMKDEFLATVSHELRTPLNAIVGWTQLLRMSREDPEEVEHGLATIERNAKAMGQLVEDVLDVSRIIRGKLRLQVRPVDLVAVIEAAIGAVRPAASAKSIQIDKQLDLRAGMISGDFDRMQQVIWNLFSNAIKFTPAGGSVSLRMSRQAGMVQIQVTDSGVGIAPAFLPHVFERFSQADTSTRRSSTGLGLGLAIVRHLVEMHGGSVFAQSDGENRGATFTVRLPAMPAGTSNDADEPAVPADFAKTLRGLHVLVVDDERDVRELVRTILIRAGAEAIAVSSADQAMSEIRRHPPDVLLSDIGMPGRDGYDLLRDARAMEQSGSPRIPAAAITGFASADDRERVLGAGYEEYLTKPLQPDELVAAVARLGGRGAATLHA